jgi:biopolymer transport protein ExbD
MQFRRRKPEDPEINLIPFIDVLLVILIFLMLSTTYSRYSELQIALPVADAERIKEKPAEIIITITADGRYLVDKRPVDGRSVVALATEIATAATALGGSPVVIVSADAMTTHQSVVNVLDAVRRAGLSRLSFAAQLSGAADGGR